MPSYSEIMSLAGFKSKNAAHKLVAKLVAAGAVGQDGSGRLIPKHLGEPIQDLAAETQPAVESTVGLPSIDNPWFDLQLLRREDLNAHACKEPWRVGGDVRRLVCPVIEVIETEQSDVGQEDSSVHIDAMQDIEVIPAVRLRQIPVRAY